MESSLLLLLQLQFKRSSPSPLFYKESSFLVCFLQNDSSDWLGCIPADSSVINRCFFSELLSSFQCYENLLSSFQYYFIPVYCFNIQAVSV